MLAFFHSPGGVTLVFDRQSGESGAAPAEPLAVSALCGPPGRMLTLVAAGTAPGSIPESIRASGGTALEAVSPGCLREALGGRPYVPASGDILRLWAGLSGCRPATALNLAFGWMPGSCLTIDLEALAHNLRAVARAAGERVGLTAMVKCDGYGAGAAPVARACLAAGATRLAV
ncbi:alanine racemase, partial [bacterium]|nr:alanine racemase [bacterium]